ncbi:short-chain dehydrogenase reductase 3b-like [Phoenix dactylifera]|uniref:Short-chain dehydrogenase reductase 3b-like n=1 Tax=Phoenix dactylifera TaxID=42345 RepID=A0A8B7D4H3_PHODC|nr:short-chain dehydrogenase reductase 3b-like [Phoenix dactylifera]
MSKPRLEGKVAIITGAASGIGEAAARLFASNGATVVIADIQDELGTAVAASISPGKCSYKHCDVTDETQVEETVNHVLRTHGRLDIMFSNAGVLGTATPILDADMGELDRVMAVNVRGTAAAVKHSARAMVARGTRGSIICTASVASCRGGLAPAAYTASKHAVLGLVRAAAGELGQHGIRVNCLSPFGVATPLACGLNGMSLSKVEDLCCAMANLKGVVLKTSHVAEAALFLASDESVFISGHNLVVDGGTTAVNSSLQQLD